MQRQRGGDELGVLKNKNETVWQEHREMGKQSRVT